MSNEALFKRAKEHLVGGVNSPVRAFGAVGGVPLFIESGAGAYVCDSEGKRYIDYVSAWGPAILGHAHPEVIAALTEQLQNGIGFGAPCTLEIELAEMIAQSFENVERVRFTNSGTEAVMSAIRLARGCTGREGVIKFIGCYHGHSDAMLTDVGADGGKDSSAAVPSSTGVPAAVAQGSHCVPYNDVDAVEKVMRAHSDEIACLIVEPVAGNMGCVLPVDGFLSGLAALCKEHGALLIFDEVMTGYRVAYGGAQNHYGVVPDLTTLGKVIGGGLPAGAVAGPSKLMSQFAPLGSVYQGGTMSGNPATMSCGKSTIEQLRKGDFYDTLSARCRQLSTGLVERAQAAGVKLVSPHVGGIFGLFFGVDAAPNNYAELQACDFDMYRAFFHAMLAEGVYFPPSPAEAVFVSGAHGTEEIEQTLKASERVFAGLKSS